MGQSYAALYCHATFSTKNRAPLITPDIRERLYTYIGGIISNHNGRLLAVGGTPDHVHLLLSLHRDTSVAEVMRLVKANSSKWVRETHPARLDFGWQTGYGAFSVSHSNVPAVQDYIARQEAHHRRVSFQEEFVEFLKRHGVEYDERYIWE